MFDSPIGCLLRQPLHTSRQFFIEKGGDANWCIPKPTASSYTYKVLKNYLDKMEKSKVNRKIYSEGDSYCTNKSTLTFLPRFSLQYMNYSCRDTRTQMKKKTKGEEKKDNAWGRKKRRRSDFLRLTSCTCLGKVVRPVNPDVFELGEVLEVQGTVLVIVELKWGVDLDVDRSLLHATK